MLLAVAAVATAWSSYQANRWNGEAGQGRRPGQRLAHRRRPRPRAGPGPDPGRHRHCSSNGSTPTPPTTTQLADFYTDTLPTRVPPRLRRLAGHRSAHQSRRAADTVRHGRVPAPGPHRRRPARRQAEAPAASAVRRNIQRSANYVLGVVLFAVALFFAGMSTKLHGAGAQQGAARRRLPHLPRHRGMDRHLPDQPLRVGRGNVSTRWIGRAHGSDRSITRSA